MPCGPLRLNGESRRRILQLDSEHRVGPGVRVLDLHVQVSQGGTVGHVLGDGDLIGVCQRLGWFRLAKAWWSPGIPAG